MLRKFRLVERKNINKYLQRYFLNALLVKNICIHLITKMHQEPNRNIELYFKTKAGFDELYNRYAPKVFSYFVHNLNNRELAEDFVQELFTKFWFKRNDIKIEDSIENYLITSAKFKLINHYHKRQKEKLFVQNDQPDPTGVPSPEDQLIYRQCKERVFNVVKKMSRTSRQIFFLSRARGLSNKEISKKMALSEKSVEYHISKTLRRLHKYITLLF